MVIGSSRSSAGLGVDAGCAETTLGAVEIPSGRAILGGVLVLAMAAGFEFEWSWLFLAGLVLFLAWAGFMLLSPGDS
jgi:hypothetical protein